MVQAPDELTGPFGQYGQGPVRIPAAQGLLGAAQPGGRPDARAVDPYRVRVRGRGGEQRGAEGGAGGVGAAQHGEGERGARVAGVLLEGVQDLGGPLPQVLVAQHVLDEQRRIEPVQDGQQVAPQRARQGAQARGFQEVGLSAGPHGEQPQHVGGGGEPLGQQGPYGLPRAALAQQGSQYQGLGLAHRDGVREPVQAGRHVGEEHPGLLGVLRRERGAAGQQLAEGGDGVGRAVGAEGQQPQRTAPGGNLPRVRGRPDERVVGVDAAVADRAAGVVDAVPAGPADQVGARGDGVDAADGRAQHARLVRPLQEQGQDAVDPQRVGVVGHRGRERAEQRHVGAVRAQQDVDVPDQLRAGGGESGGSQPGECRTQRARQGVAPVEQFGFQGRQALGRRRVARARPGLVDVDGVQTAQQDGRQLGQRGESSGTGKGEWAGAERGRATVFRGR